MFAYVSNIEAKHVENIEEPKEFLLVLLFALNVSVNIKQEKV